MILKPVDIDKEKLIFDETQHEYTWAYYFKQYANVLNYIISISVEKHYRLNCMHRAVMFIFRHTVELYFKMSLDAKGIRVQNTHNLSELINELGENFSQEFVNRLEILMPKEEGDNFKYLENKKGQRFYQNNEILDVLPSIFSFITDENVKKMAIFPVFLDLNDKILRGEWRFYTREVYTLGQIKTQYDSLISELLSAIKNDELRIDDVYLPLLFLIRHSLELAFKDNASELYEILSKKQQDNCHKSHSLVALFNIVDFYVKKVMDDKDMLPDSDVIRKDIEKYLPMSENLCTTIHKMDCNSFSFRFPIDRDGNSIKIPFERNLLCDSVSTYQEADAFISLSIGFLKYNNNFFLKKYPKLFDDYFAEQYGWH